MNQGADIRRKPSYGGSPADCVTWTVLGYKTLFSLKIPTREFDSLMRVFNVTDELDTRGFSILHKVVLGLSNLKLEPVLNDRSSDINATDADGRTALWWAVARAQDEDVGLLLEHGADPFTKDVFGEMALIQAASSPRSTNIKLLIERVLSTSLQQPSRPVHDDGSLMALALEEAIFYGCWENATYLVERTGVNINMRTKYGWPAIWKSIRRSVKFTKFLRSRGADIEYHDPWGTLLHRMVDICDPAMMQAYAEMDWSGIDPTVGDDEDRTALEKFQAYGARDPRLKTAFLRIHQNVQDAWAARHGHPRIEELSDSDEEEEEEEEPFLDALEDLTPFRRGIEEPDG